MKFSQYLRTLDEGNLGHELEKQEKAKKENTVDDHGEVMLDPVTGKPFPKKGPLKDWQIPSLEESERPGEAINYGRDEEDEPEREEEEWDGHEPKPRNTKTAKQLGIEAKRKANESIEAPERDALGRLSIQVIGEGGVGHMRRQLASKNIPASQKREVQQRLHDKETRDKPRQLKRAGDPNTPLDVAVNAADRASDPVTPAPKKQRVLTPADKAKAKKNAPKWVKKKEQDAIDAHDVAEADRRENAVGMDRQSHLDEPK